MRIDQSGKVGIGTTMPCIETNLAADERRSDKQSRFVLSAFIGAQIPFA
jgi:hypothetical protein